MKQNGYGQQLRDALGRTEIMPFIGVYDVFSATLAAKHYDAIFISGFSFAASHYGLPDIGFIAWSDIVAFCLRMRAVLPRHHIMVDIDDGYGDAESAAHVVSLLNGVGASGVILEDQLRPRRCGHFDGKQLLNLDQYLIKLDKVLATRKDLFVIARTDATEFDEIERRAHAFAEAGADAILIDGLRDLNLLKQLKLTLNKPLMFNQIAGGKSPPCTLSELKAAGVSLVNYSTPCLFAVQAAIEETMLALKENGGRLPDGIGVDECNAILKDNLCRRDAV
jgi:2-methylisocitrate lyase-like PEP mutase family enzyme